MTGAPGRPRTFDEDVVLERAVDLFWRSGYRSTTTRDLEATLGVSQSSLYNAFGSKQGLMRAVLDRYEARMGPELLEPLETGPDGLAAIYVFFDTLVRTVTGEGRAGCMIINLMAEDGGDNPEMSRRTRTYRMRVHAALGAAVNRAAADGHIKPDYLAERADLLFGVVMGINLLARGGAPATEVNRMAESVHRLVDTWRM